MPYAAFTPPPAPSAPLVARIAALGLTDAEVAERYKSAWIAERRLNTSLKEALWDARDRLAASLTREAALYGDDGDDDARQPSPVVRAPNPEAEATASATPAKPLSDHERAVAWQAAYLAEREQNWRLRWLLDLAQWRIEVGEVRRAWVEDGDC